MRTKYQNGVIEGAALFIDENGVIKDESVPTYRKGFKMITIDNEVMWVEDANYGADVVTGAGLFNLTLDDDVSGPCSASLEYYNLPEDMILEIEDKAKKEKEEEEKEEEVCYWYQTITLARGECGGVFDTPLAVHGEKCSFCGRTISLDESDRKPFGWNLRKRLFG